jgi:hypothetical protein
MQKHWIRTSNLKDQNFIAPHSNVHVCGLNEYNAVKLKVAGYCMESL